MRKKEQKEDSRKKKRDIWKSEIQILDTKGYV
jgi:hypothetical protein